MLTHVCNNYLVQQSLVGEDHQNWLLLLPMSVEPMKEKQVK